MKLSGKTILITGAAQRIGREIAIHLAKRGAEIIIHYSHSEREAASVQKEIRRQGSNAFLVRADFAGPRIGPAIKKFTAGVFKQVSRVDVLINNASVFYPTPIGKISERDWDNVMAINLKAPILLAQEFGMRMVRQKAGKIINLADWTGARPRSRYLAYCVSKAGLIAATSGLAKALAPYVQVNAIAPGPILPAAGSTEKENKKIVEKTLLKRFGHPGDIAETVRFLIEGTDFITGAVIPVDGGAMLV